MWDYWLGQNHNRCGPDCASALHGIFEAYMAPPSGKGSLSRLETALVDMFEIRVGLEFSLEDILAVSMNTSDEDHHLARSGLQRMALEFHQFAEVCARLDGLLDDGQCGQTSHLEPISARLDELVGQTPDLRESVVNPGSGLFGIVTTLNGGGPGASRMPDNSALVCANLINTFVDGLMHAIPDTFRTAFSKLPSNGEPVKLYDFGPFADMVSSHIRKNPIHCLDFASMGDASVPIASELIRLRWALTASLDIYRLTNRLQTVPHQMPKLWSQLQCHRMALYLKHMVTELYIFIDLYDRMRKASPAPLADDNVIRELLERRDEIGRLRNIAVNRAPDGEYVSFSAALGDGIGHEKILFLAGVASEWIRINANHFQERCQYGASVPDLPDMGKYLDAMAAEHEAALYRVRAQNALDRKSAIPAMVQ